MNWKHESYRVDEDGDEDEDDEDEDEDEDKECDTNDHENPLKEKIRNQLQAGDALQQEIPAQERKTGQSGRSRIRRAKQKKRKNTRAKEERKRDA
ncbi:uncharacterized protein LOC143265005 [Megachile rotundata]|uniref:uncharacterized protein LOC143265005 n=1 Tax=Megachile rotundata TaxID=143995 RepID=UPI003FD2C05D